MKMYPTFVLSRFLCTQNIASFVGRLRQSLHRKETCVRLLCPQIQRSLHLSRNQRVCRSVNLNSSKTSRKSASIAALGSEADVSADSQRTLLWQRYIYVQTSVERWEDVPGGVYLDAAYLDSAPGDKYNPAVPVVVGLHSTPGNFYDLQPVLEAFAKCGCRVVAPAFPGNDHV